MGEATLTTVILGILSPIATWFDAFDDIATWLMLELRPETYNNNEYAVSIPCVRLP